MCSEGGRSCVAGEARARGIFLGDYAENPGESADEIGGRRGRSGAARAIY